MTRQVKHGYTAINMHSARLNGQPLELKETRVGRPATDRRRLQTLDVDGLNIILQINVTMLKSAKHILHHVIRCDLKKKEKKFADRNFFQKRKSNLEQMTRFMREVERNYHFCAYYIVKVM